MTDSPVSDTSEELIEPALAVVEQRKSSCEANLARIRRFLVALTHVPHVSAAEIFFTDGGDTSFEEFTVSAERFDEVALAIFLAEPEIPSTKFIVSWHHR